jgi:hypothetical protein
MLRFQEEFGLQNMPQSLGYLLAEAVSHASHFFSLKVELSIVVSPTYLVLAG